MPFRRPHIAASAAQSELADALAQLREQFDLPTEFPEDVVADAKAAAASVALPELDMTDVEFMTIDPEGSTDLDQAMHLHSTRDGYRVRYAIADVPALVTPGGAVDTEARRRGQTLYAADGRIPLHPPAIGDDAGSLLPGKVRGAFVWDFDLDALARQRSVTLRRARIRSRARWDYRQAQAGIEAGSASESLRLLEVVGRARIRLERERGGASLNSPDEEIVFRDGSYTIERRMPLPVEDWNAQISLMTGMAAAQLMLSARVGILRTMPAPDVDAIAAFRVQTAALGQPWPDYMPYGEYLRSLRHDDPTTPAVLQAATALFRGAGYVVLNGSLPEHTEQAAVAAPYAHATAPLRRLVDRWSLIVCEAISTGADVPAWARDSLAQLPKIMEATSRVASQLNAASVNRVEAALLAGSVGHEFTATVLVVRGASAVVQLSAPSVTATCRAIDGLAAGAPVRIRLDAVDIASGSVTFSISARP
jgi:exoribonuclease R